MPDLDDLSIDPDTFDGTARLFPLPNLVLFPHVMQPLHVFEPRYRALVEAALASDRLVGMAVLLPGWENDYEGRPPIYQTLCLAKIMQHQRLDDGKFNLLVVGLRRVKIVRELPPNEPFREAEVELLEDESPIGGGGRLKRELLESFRQRMPTAEEGETTLQEMFGDKVSLAALTDVMGFALDLPLADKATLLANLQVSDRARRIIDHLNNPESSPQRRFPGGFPPPFSNN